MKRKQECAGVIFGCVLRIFKTPSLERRGKFLHFKVTFLAGSSASYITRLLWVPTAVMSRTSTPLTCSVILYLSHAQLCVEIDLLGERGVVEGCACVCVTAQRAFDAACVCLVTVTITELNKIR